MVYYLGIDIGGTKIKGVLLRGLSKQKPKCFVINTPKNKKQFFRALEEFSRKIAAGEKISGVGVGIRGIVDSEKGILIYDKILPFLNGWNIRQFFKKFKAPVRVDNDSRCFLRAEFYWGAGRGYKNVVALAIGTGIGGGLVIDGKVYRGSHNSAGEFGHMILQVQGSKSKVQSCDFEELAAKNAFLKYGDRSVIMGIGIANLINAFDPDIVILGGGGVGAGSVKIEKVRRVARNYILSPVAAKTLIIRGRLGLEAQAIGAALLFREDQDLT